MRKCRFCKKEIADSAVVCPHCGNSLIPGRQTQPSETPAPVAAGTPVQATKRCPYCAEEIQTAAVLCKHCNRNIPAVAQKTGTGKTLGVGCLAIVGLFVAGVFLLIVIGMFASPSTSSSSTAVGSHTVEYRVRGTARAASLTYQNASGGTEQRHDETLPWTYQLGEAHRGQFLYISAQNSGSYGTIIAEIVIDGVVVKHSESEGQYTIASASGRY
jgi:hypothetical protein